MNNELTKSKETAANRAFLGGFFGLQHYYLEEISSGIYKSISGAIIAMFLLTTALGGVFAFSSFLVFYVIISNVVAGLKLLGTDSKQFDLKYNPHLFVKIGDTLPTPASVEVADEILKLNDLFEKGIITFEEFERRKAKLLD
jgi:hypothetical protein